MPGDWVRSGQSTRGHLLTALTAIVLCLLPTAGSALDRTALAGVASVIDGDTLEIHRTRIRLNGIDAPESSQFCRKPNGEH